MNTKRLITTSIFALISASTVQAADVMIPHQPTPVTSSTSSFVAPAFTWEGFYFGGQGGGFTSKTDMSIVSKHKTKPLSKDLSPKLSGFEGGLYAGSNIDLGDNFVLSIDTDFTWSGQKHTKTITIAAPENNAVDSLLSRARKSTETVSAKPIPTTQASAKSASTASSSINSAGSAQKNPAGSTQTNPAGSTQTNPAGSTQTKQTGSTQTKQTGSTQTKQTAKAGVNAGGTSPRSSTVPSPLTSTTSTPKASASTKLTGTAQTKPATSGGADTVVVLRSLTPQTSSVGRSASSSARSVSLTSNSVKKVGDSGQKAEAVTSGAGKAQSGEARQRVLMSSSSQATQSTVSQAVGGSGTKTSSASVAGSDASGVSTATPASVASKVEATVPKQPLVLARSGSSGSEENTASDGGKHAQGHGASHGSGHGSGANPHGKGIHNPHSSNPHAASSRGSNPHGAQSGAGRSAQGTQEAENASDVYGIEQIREMVSELGLEDNGPIGTLSHTLKQNWVGATRVRIGFAADRFMPYVAGGVAYTQLQDTVSVSIKRDDGTVVASKNLTDETKTMVGYTIGGGVDFAMLDNVILRAEYRYSDFGKKKFAKEKLEIKYTTNDFRVGVAYKF